MEREAVEKKERKKKEKAEEKERIKREAKQAAIKQKFAKIDAERKANETRMANEQKEAEEKKKKEEEEYAKWKAKNAPSPDQPFPLPGPNDMLPYEPTEGADGAGMINATLFRKMGPEMAMKDGQYQYEGPKSWSNSPNGQNKAPEEGMPDNKGAPPG